MTILPSASGLTRALHCPASTVLPKVRRESSAFVQQRIDFHAFVDAVNKRGLEAAIAEAPEDMREVWGQMDLSALPTDPNAYATEVALAWDPTTDKARELNRAGTRDYADARETEYVGTADAVALLGDDAVWVGDIKPRFTPNVPPAHQNWQLRFLALAMCRLHGRSRAVVELIHADESGSWRDRAEFDALELDLIAGELALLGGRIAEDRAKGQAEPTEGSWCRYCDSFAHCPAKQALATALATGRIGVPAGTELALTPENAGVAWQRVKQAEQVLERIREALEQFAREQPFATPDGLVVSAGERRTESIDGNAAHAVLERLGINVGEWKVTKTAIAKAAGKGRSEEVLEALRKAGVVKTTISNPIQERRQ